MQARQVDRGVFIKGMFCSLGLLGGGLTLLIWTGDSRAVALIILGLLCVVLTAVFTVV
jgi:hypothetical protein